MPTSGGTAYPDHYYPQPQQFDTTDFRQVVQKDEVELAGSLAEARQELRRAQLVAESLEIVDRLEPEDRALLDLEGFSEEGANVEVQQRLLDLALDAESDLAGQRAGFLRQDLVEAKGRFRQVFQRKISELLSLRHGLVALRELQWGIDQCDDALEQGERGLYMERARELGVVLEFMERFYKEGKAYNGPVRRARASMMGIPFLGGGAQLSPNVCLEPSHSADEATAIMTHKHGRPGIMPAFLRRKEPLTGEEVRQNLLVLARAEVANWAERDNPRVLLSWKLFAEYVGLLVEQLGRIEGVEELSQLNLSRLMASFLGDRKRMNEQIHGQGFVDSIMRSEHQGEKAFNVAQFVRSNFREFMEFFRGTDLAREIIEFARADEGITVAPHVHDTLVDHGHYILREGREAQGDDKAKIKAWRRAGDLVEGGVNPIVFNEADLEDRVLMRLVESIGRMDLGYQAAMCTGEGNALRSDTFEQALTEKMWFMERKWRSLSPGNRKKWLTGEFGRVISPEGAYGDTICLGAEDYHTG